MKVEQLRKLRTLAREHNIHFVLDTNPDQWPDRYRTMFTATRDTGRIMFDEYGKSAGMEIHLKPWKSRIKARAEILRERATRASREGLNESGWRFALEPEVFYRFTVEVSCKECRARLWQSEIEPPENNFEPLAQSLRARREKRQPCRCPQEGRALDQEAGLNELFSDRVEEHIYHDPVIRKELPKEDYPDRIYGLRRTKHFDRVLSKRYLHEHPEDGPTRLISDVIPSSPFDTSVENLLFPFLIIEAKSEKGSVGFDNIQAQTAFPIRALLVLQDKLHQAANNDTIQIGRPLVWFIACQGDLWRLYAAYPDHHEGETKYQVLALWDGRLTTKDGALQIILLIDYIFEWARDIFRSDLLAQLKILSKPSTADAPSPTADSDIRSMIDGWRQDVQMPMLPSDVDFHTKPPDVDLDFGHLDTEFGSIRNAVNIESRLLGVLLDDRNIDEFIKLLGKDMGKKIARQLVRLFTTFGPGHGALCTVARQTLRTVEELWTGCTSASESAEQEQTKLIATMHFATYISCRWNQIRELSYIAMSTSAFGRLWKLAETTRTAYRKPDEISAGALHELILRLKSGSMEHNLAAAISLTTLSLPRCIFEENQRRNLRTTTELSEHIAPLTRHEDWMGYELVLYAFELSRQNQPWQEHTESFFRFSSCQDKQTQLNDESIRPIDIGRLNSHPAGMVLVYGEVGNKTRLYQEVGNHNIPDQCLFVLKSSPTSLDKSKLGDILRDYLIDWDIYQTIRHEWSWRKTNNIGTPHRNTPLEFAKVSTQLFVYLTKWRYELGFPPLDNPPLPSGASMNTYFQLYGHRLPVAGNDFHWEQREKKRIESRRKERQRNHEIVNEVRESPKENDSEDQTSGSNRHIEMITSPPDYDTPSRPSKKQRIVIEID